MYLKLALGPLLLWQGRQVRARALRLPEAAGPREGWVPAPAGQGSANAAAQAALTLWVVGDSSGAGVGVAQQHAALAQPLAVTLARRWRRPVAWRLLATTGHTAADALGAFKAAAPSSKGGSTGVDLLVTALGVNDVVAQTRPAKFLAQLDALHAATGARLSLHSAIPAIGRFPLLPQPLRAVLGRDALALDAALRHHLMDCPDRIHVPLPVPPQLAAGRQLATVMPPGWMAADGFHPGPLGYPAWVAALAAVVPPSAEVPHCGQ